MLSICVAHWKLVERRRESAGGAATTLLPSRKHRMMAGKHQDSEAAHAAQAAHLGVDRRINHVSDEGEVEKGRQVDDAQDLGGEEQHGNCHHAAAEVVAVVEALEEGEAAVDHDDRFREIMARRLLVEALKEVQVGHELPAEVSCSSGPGPHRHYQNSGDLRRVTGIISQRFPSVPSSAAFYARRRRDGEEDYDGTHEGAQSGEWGAVEPAAGIVRYAISRMEQRACLLWPRLRARSLAAILMTALGGAGPYLGEERRSEFAVITMYRKNDRGNAEECC